MFNCQSDLLEINNNMCKLNYLMSTLRNHTNLEQIIRQVVEVNDKARDILSKGKKVTQEESVDPTEALKQISEGSKDFLEPEGRTSIVGKQQASYVATVKDDGGVDSTIPREHNADDLTSHNKSVNAG